MAKVGKCPCGAKLTMPEGPIEPGQTLKCGACGRVLKLNASKKPQAPAPEPAPPAGDDPGLELNFDSPPPPAPKPEAKAAPPPPPPDDDLELELEDDGATPPAGSAAPAPDSGPEISDDEDGGDETIEAEPSGPGIGGGQVDEARITPDGPGTVETTDEAFEVSLGGEDKDTPETPAQAASQPAEPGGTCPECDKPYEAGAVLCVHCGYHLRTGTKMNVKVVGEDTGPSFWDEFKREFAEKWKTWGCLFVIVGILLLVLLIMKIF